MSKLTVSLLNAVLLAVLLAPLAASAQGYRGPTRINFDERLIKGQTAKAGSVYIFQRKAIENESLVRVRRVMRAKVIRSVFEDSIEGASEGEKGR
jgi:hypothetical protein